MNKANRAATCIAFAMVIGAAAAARADLESGKEAYQRGNYHAAREELLPLAEAGDADAQVYLGLMHATGRGVDKDQQAAARWYRLAADQGQADGQFNLGLMYAKGQGVPLNYAAAVHLYKQAAEQGHAGARLNLGVCYSRGYGVLRDEQLAADWFRQAAEQDNAAAQFNLGLMYAMGKYGGGPDPVQAVEWYTKAAEQGYPPAQLNLGVSYERGVGVSQDLGTAAYWYRLAAKGGNETARGNLKRVVAVLGASPTAQPEAIAIEEGGVVPVLAETASPNGEGVPLPDPDESDIGVPAEKAAPDPAVGNIVTRTDAVVEEVDAVVVNIGDVPSPAAPVAARSIETAPVEEVEIGDSPSALSVSNTSEPSSTDELMRAWRNRGQLPAAAQRVDGAAGLQEQAVP
jgi:TPR repeat protein